MLKSIPASGLLRKLRWSTLGLQFDWSKQNYNVSLPHNKIPDALCQLAKKMAAPAMLGGKEFRPEAAIVNYFRCHVKSSDLESSSREKFMDKIAWRFPGKKCMDLTPQ
ncbi:Alpha-ketoglutarate-dependent dioxygenase alkB [Camellia lanceoleosa]|uniref:Alpha-ketoglutarate-dependent dioxygenase alkB n=1 Tax=Camellia lanceoleosa TaxID=1840588 RepID=A0ACC0F8Y0_9ERIC|nr:Alpha-ketoglutarate-dependent dioxygenase alkB [Camellia lanceoleosa]